ncbi:MAG: alpha/beta fold hydrolase [Pseudomonadota bacterium]
MTPNLPEALPYEPHDQMLKALLGILSTSYIAWYLENHESMAVYPFDTTYVQPSNAGAPNLSETRFVAEDGTELIIWTADARGGQPTILYLSGNAGGLRDRADRLNILVDAGFGVVAPAYRGSSGSSGSPEEELLIDDAHALSENLPYPTILYGESLGAALAIRLAASGFGSAVVLEAPFTSLIDLLAVQYPNEDVADSITQRWESMSHIGSLTQKLLVIHGENDRLVPFSMGKRIFNAAASDDKLFLRVAGAGHTDLWTDDVLESLFVFLGQDF